MINVHAQILYGRSKEQFDNLASAFKRDAKLEPVKPAIQPQSSPATTFSERFRTDAEKQKKG